MAHGSSLFAGHFAGPIRFSGNPPAPIPPISPTPPRLIPPRLIPPRISGETDGGDGDPGLGDDTFSMVSPTGATASQASAAAEANRAPGSLWDVVTGREDLPAALDTFFENPRNLFSALAVPLPLPLSFAFSAVADFVADVTAEKMAYNTQQAHAGVPGYGIGYDRYGEQYTVSPGGLVTGNVDPEPHNQPTWEQIDAATANQETKDLPGPGWGSPFGDWGGPIDEDEGADPGTGTGTGDENDPGMDFTGSGDQGPFNTGGLVAADRLPWPLMRPPSNVRRGLGSLADAPWGALARMDRGRMDRGRLGRRW
jgi:hypothetical protein